MTCYLKNAKIYRNGSFSVSDVELPLQGNDIVFENHYLFPGFADVHVHFREPGFSYKETIQTGSLAAAHGGYCAVCAMPNLKPVPDSKEHLLEEIALIKSGACINVFPYASITENEEGNVLSEMDEMAPYAIAFSDDGRGVQNDAMMRTAMLNAKRLNKLICAHCEDNSLLFGGYIHKGIYCAEHGHRGICSESEWKQIERDLKLVAETGCGYHVCHISTKESVQLIRDAKKSGLDVTCETGPHYLVLTDADLQEDGRFKMNPPLRSSADKEALLMGISDGTIDMIATDHAPHSAKEKSRGLEKSAMGIVGLETAFPVLYTELVKNDIISLEKLIALMHDNPCKRFGIDLDPESNYTIFDLTASYRIDPNSFLSMGRSTPFAGRQVFGECVMTVCGGKLVWKRISTEN